MLNQIVTIKIAVLCANKLALAHLKMLSTKYSFTNHINNVYMYKEDLVLNNIQGLICHKT